MINLYSGRCLLLFVFFLAIACSGCKSKTKPSLSGDEVVDVADFLSVFPEVSLPVVIGDTTLAKKSLDSTLISYRVFNTFIPDSVLKKDFGKSKPKLYPLGKTREKRKESYLFVKATQGSRRAAYVICLDKNDRFLTAMPLVKSGPDNTYTSAYGSLDKKFQITTYRETKTKSGTLNFKRNIFIYNDASKEFTLIVTEPGQESTEDILNPLDTFSQKNKFTGDYVLDKKNFISFRDNKKSSDINFFVHFEKNKRECKGEIRGTARFVSPKIAQYKENGNPCTLEFVFSPSAVVMKEVEGCGSYRDIKCFFDGTYPKKKKKPSKPVKAAR